MNGKTLMTRKVIQYSPSIGAEEYKAVGDCFDANWLTEGPRARPSLRRSETS
jgi:hypothetical protein